jgi:hypothetical protein
MARSAVLVSRISHIMRRRLDTNAVALAAEITGAIVAFEADRKDYRSPQHARIHRSMWRMTRFTSIHPDRRVLE